MAAQPQLVVSDRVSVAQAFAAALGARGFSPDQAQAGAIARLERMREELLAFKARRSNRLKKLIVHPEVPRGVWLHGGVGRGKSFLMDCFFAAVPYRRKLRLHFHEFMRGVHRELDELKGTQDPLEALARRVAKRYRLICFDEFHVADIADAMILERLMRGLFNNGVTFVITSNYAPDALYPEGLHRDRVLPAIALLNEQLDVLSVDAGVDYRQLTVAGVRAYLSPAGKDADQALLRMYCSLAQSHDEDPWLVIENRRVHARRRCEGVVWFDFDTLCGGPRSQNDYLALASRFNTVIVSNVPRMDASMSSPARRFVWLVDVLYDQRVKLLISAQCPPEELYTEGALAGEFARTVSRITEMQSREYLEAQRRGQTARLS